MQTVQSASYGMVDAERAKIDKNLAMLKVGEESHSVNFTNGRWCIATQHIFLGASLDCFCWLTVGNTVYCYRRSDLHVETEDIDDTSFVKFPEKDLEGKYLPEFADITHLISEVAPQFDSAAFALPVLVQGLSGQWTETKVVDSAMMHRYTHHRTGAVFPVTAFSMAVVEHPGSCCRWIVRTSPDSNGVIIGRINSGSDYRTYASIVSRDRVLRHTKPRDIQAFGYVSSTTFNKDDPRYRLLTTNFTRATEYQVVLGPNGKPICFNYPLNDSGYEPNPLADEHLQSVQRPAHLLPFYDASHNRLDPTAIRLQKLDVKETEDKVNYALMFDVMKELDNRIHGNVQYDPISIDSAFFGDARLRIRPFQLNSGAGFINGRKLKNRDLVDFSGPSPRLHDWVFAEFCNAKLNPAHYPGIMSKKDELLEAEFVDAGKMRLFFAMNTMFNLRGKALMARYLSILRQNGTENGIAIGTQFGLRFKVAHIVQKLKQFPDHVVILADIKNYEKYRSDRKSVV